MEESWAFVKLCEASVGVDSSDETTTFRWNLRMMEANRHSVQPKNLVLRCLKA